MKTTPILKYLSRSLALVAALNSMSGVSVAAVITKADTADTMDQTTAWVGGVVPTAADTALFDNTLSGANTAFTFGADASWLGLKVANPAASLVLGAGNTLTLGSGGIDMSTATAGLALNNATALGATQIWNVGAGSGLTNAGVISGSFGLVKTGAGTLVMSIAADTYTGGTVLGGGTNIISTVAAGHFGTGAVSLTNNATLILFSGNAGDPGGGGGAFSNSWNVPAGETANFWNQWRGTCSGPVSGSGTVNLRVNGTRGEWTANWSGFSGQLNVTSRSGTADDFRINIGGSTNLNGFANCKVNLSNGAFMYQSANPPNGGATASTTFQQIGELSGNAAGTLSGNLIAGRFVNWQIGFLNTDSTFFGRIVDNTGATRITKLGTGSLTLAGTNTLTGSITVLNGKLVGATGGSASNTVAISVTGGTLGVLVNPAGNQWVGNNITNAAGTSLEFNYGGSTPSASIAPLLCRSNFSPNATTSVRIVGGNWALGAYPLVKYTGLLGGGGFAALSLASQPARVSGFLSNDVANAQIVYVVTSSQQPLRWAVGNGIWDLATANWVDQSLAVTTYQEAGGFGDAVQFEDSLSGASPLTVSLNSAVIPASVSVTGAKNWTISGTGSIGGFASLTKSGAGTLTISTLNGFSGGANLNGGVTVFSALGNLGAANSAISFGGGTLAYSSGNTADISAGRVVSLASGGGTIDTANNNVTFGSAIGNNGVGGLTKVGSGTLTLSGANRFSGTAAINAGSLALAAGASITNSANISVGVGTLLNVSASGIVLNGAVGQSLTGSGTVSGTVTVGAGASVAPGAGAATLTVGNLVMNGGTYNFDVSTGSGKDLVAVTNDLTLTSGVVQVNVTGTLTNGRYPLFTYSGILNGAAGNLIVSGFSQVGKIASVSGSVVGSIDLVVSTAGGANKTWAGVGADWDVETSSNWNGGAAQFVNGDFAIFDDSGAGVSSVNLTSALLPGGVTVNSSAGVADYTFSSGSGGLLSGSAALTKSGSSTLTVLTADNRSGPTTINAGVVQVGNGSTTGALGSGNITNNASLVFQQTDNRSVVGAIRGSGSLTQNGATVLTLSGATEYTGPTTIASGATLQFGSGAATGSTSTSAINDDGRVVFNSSTSWTNNAVISGTGEVVKQGTGTMTLGGANTYGGNTYVSNGIVKLASSERIPHGDLTTGWLILDGGATAAGSFDLNGFNETVNGLQGLGGTVQGRVYNSAVSTVSSLIVSNETATAFAGLIQDNPGTGGTVTLIKDGSAQLNLTGLNSFSGTTIVRGGTLAVGSGGQVGTGGIIFSNGTTFNMSANTPSVFPGNQITIATGGTVAFASANTANGIGGSIVGDATSTNSIVGPISIGAAGTKQYQNFPGTVQIEATGSIRFSSTGLNINGGDNTTFVNEGTINTRNGTVGANSGVYLGALFGNGILGSGGAGAGGSTYIIGTKNIDSTFSGQIVDVNAATNVTIIKGGTGTLTLNGSVTYHGSTTVSNGVLNISGSANLDNSSSIAIRSGAKLDVSAAGTMTIGSLAAQTLGGSGTVWGSVAASGGSVATINPGDAIGTLTITNDLSLAANTIVNLEINRTNAQTADKIVAATFVGGGASVVVTNLGPTLVTGDTFSVFSGPVTGLGSVSLPTANADNSVSYTWTNMIAINGTIKVLSGASAVNPNPTNVTATVTGGGSTLTLTWPSSHIGWTLQAQTNSLSIGLSGTWFDVSGTATTNQIIVPIVPGNPAVFYRLKL